MRILITGATGFAGRHLSRLSLSKRGTKVYGLVRNARSASRLAPGVRPLRADLLSTASLASALRKVRPDRVYHLAGQASVKLSWKKPKLTFDVNVRGTRCLLEAALRVRSRARILIACSADEYGAPRLRKKLDEGSPLKPVNPYGASKLVQDLLALHYFQSHGLPVVRTRAFNHIGPGQDERFAVSSFAKQVAAIERGDRKPRIDVGNLEAVRDFTDVRDVVQGYRLALEKGRPGEAYNVASGRGRRLAEVLRFYLRRSSVKIKVRRDRARLRVSDAPYLVGDARKLRRETGWRPRIRFEKSLRDVFEDWKGRPNG